MISVSACKDIAHLGISLSMLAGLAIGICIGMVVSHITKKT